MSILDDVLAATISNGGPVIISEQHDVNRIDWEAGLWDKAEMLKAGGNVVAQAIGRASLDTSNGRVAVMVAGKAPWHKLGVNVAEAVSSADALRLASLDWTVQKLPLNYTDANGIQREARGVYAIARQDTGEMLGSVGSRYAPIQNAEGFDFLDSVLGDFGARYESAGAIYGGKKTWMLVHLPKQRFSVGNGDAVEPYAIFTNSHDGSGAANCYPTTERVVCANTFRIAQRDKGNGMAIRHTGNVRSKIKAAQNALGLAVQGFEEFGLAAHAMSFAPLPMGGIKHYANDVLDAVLEVTAADAMKGADVLTATLRVTEAQRDLERKSFERKIERRGEVLQDILERYEGPTNGVNGMRGTVWSAFNSVTEHADHGQRYKGSDATRASRRFEETLDGAADTMKQAAYQTATRYLAV